MRWLWPLRRERKAAQAHADAALEASRERRATASLRATEARKRAARWKQWQEENHFAEGFRRAMEGR